MQAVESMLEYCKTSPEVLAVAEYTGHKCPMVCIAIRTRSVDWAANRHREISRHFRSVRATDGMTLLERAKFLDEQRDPNEAWRKFR